MQFVITKQKDHYLFKDGTNEYHLSIEKYNELGREKAIEFVTEEIKKKLQSNYQESDIDFKRARKLGFCEYGIKDFCNKLNLDVKETYSISSLKEKLTEEAFLTYPSECLKLFGKGVFEKFGGPKQFLDNNRTQQALSLVLTHVLPEKEKHKLACEFALKCVDNYEKQFPGDVRVRNAIQANLDWIEGNITDEELEAAWSAARSAAWSAAESAWSAARSAARSAWSAAESAAWSAAESAWSAARSAARSAWSAAESAESAAESAAWSAARSAWSAAESAAESAAWSAAESAESAAESAWSAARSAARSAWSAAESAESAAESAAWSAAINEQIDKVLKLL